MSALSGLAMGGLGGVGATLAVYALPRNRRPGLEQRLGPYLRDAPRRSSLLVADPARTPFPTLERVLRPIMGDAIRLLDRTLGGAASTRRRLEQAGRNMTLDQFRAEQVWAAIGLLMGVGASVLLLANRRPPLMLLLLCLVTTLMGVVLRDYALGQEVRKREQRTLAEFPTVAEMLALAVGAGEGPVGALERVTRTSHGELAKELATALA